MADLKQVIGSIPFVVVGGVATRLYMPERATLDVDVLVDARDLARVEDHLALSGGQKLGDLTTGGSSWQLPDGSALDVIASNQSWVAPALTTPRLGPDGLPYVDLPYLVVMKLQASRAQDIADTSRMLGLADDVALARVREAVAMYIPDAIEDLESLITLGKLELGGSPTG